ncbi:winged helix-turn-helix domain-containing protein [Colwellia sp. C1TZA3]|nr:winged helix-turn-helix domain-containing protein [Colwellia sp. C1TZA3]
MFPILCAFNAHEGKTLTREFLLAYGWGLGNKVSNNVTVAILELRVLLSKQPSLEIVAVRGKGYQMFNKSKWNVK